jgi:Zn-dependent peptidase ImmA (M78 family)/transcriptional regulator with XRE-family HTH domain
MPFNAALLRGLIREPTAELGAIARSARVSLAEIEAWANGAVEPSKSDVAKLSKALAVPPFYFYRKQPRIRPIHILDFRKAVPEEAELIGQPLREIQRATEYIHLLSRLYEENDELFKGFTRQRFRVGASNETGRLASQVREALGLTEERQNALTTPAAFYKFLRGRTEQEIAPVFQSSLDDSSIKGITVHLEGEIFDTFVMVNTKAQSDAARLFSLAHEIYHVLNRHSGISNFYRSPNGVERSANSFAARLLMPRGLVRRLSGDLGLSTQSYELDAPRRLAYRLKVSQFAAAIRIRDLGLVPKDFVDRWLEQFAGRPRPDEVSRRGGGDQTDPALAKIARYGLLFSTVVPSAVQRNLIDPSVVFRYSRLKPRFIESLSATARGRLGELDADSA